MRDVPVLIFALNWRQGWQGRGRAWTRAQQGFSINISMKIRTEQRLTNINIQWKVSMRRSIVQMMWVAEEYSAA